MNGPTHVAPAAERLDRTAIQTRREAVHAELLAALQAVERYKGALALLDDLLRLADPEATA